MKLTSFFVFFAIFLGFGGGLKAQAPGEPGVIGLNSPLFRRNHPRNGDEVKVINMTKDADAQINIGNIDRGTIEPNGKILYNYGYGPGEPVDVDVSVCGSVAKIIPTNPLPGWMATDSRLIGLAITPEYVTSDPPMNAVRDRVKAIEKVLKRYSDKEEKMSELQTWFVNFKNKGPLPHAQAVCENPILIPGKIFAQRNWPGDYCLQPAHIILKIVGSNGKYAVEGVGWFPQY